MNAGQSESEKVDIQSDLGNLIVCSPMVAVEKLDNSRNIVLTYDDGPEPTGTHEILTALADTKATATFFVLITRTRRNPSLLDEILAQGHEIALHGPDHRSIHAMSSSEVENRTREAKHVLEDAINRPVRWFRPPYGNQSKESWLGVIRAGLVPVHWTLACNDWEDARSDDYEQYMAEVRAHHDSGAIILCHDNCALESIDNANPVKDPLFNREKLARMIIGNFKEKGLACSSLERALVNGKPIYQPWPTTS